MDLLEDNAADANGNSRGLGQGPPLGFDITNYTFWHLCIISCFNVGGGCAIQISTTQLMEAAICEHMRQTSNIQIGQDCKGQPVQSKVTEIMGWTQLIESLLGILFLLAQTTLTHEYMMRPKRKLALALTGCLFDIAAQAAIIRTNSNIPIELVCVAPLLNLIGGGGAAVNATVTIYVTASIRSEVKRPLHFAYLRVVIGIAVSASFLGTGQIMSTYGPWNAWWMGFGMITSALLLQAILLPDIPSEDATQPYEPLDNDVGTGHALDRALGPFQTVEERTRMSLILLLIISVASDYLLTIIMKFSLIYVSKIFGWSMSKASIALSASNIVLVIPAIIFALRIASDESSQPLVQWIRVSLLSAVVGCLVMTLTSTSSTSLGFLFGAAMAGFGAPYVCFTRSLIVSLVRPDYRSNIANWESAAESLGRMSSGLVNWLAWDQGMTNGFLGLPFAVTTAICGGALALSIFVHV